MTNVATIATITPTTINSGAMLIMLLIASELATVVAAWLVDMIGIATVTTTTRQMTAPIAAAMNLDMSIPAVLTHLLAPE